MTPLLGILALCVASAVLGRLLLTREQAQRTLMVRAPAALLLVISAVISGLAILVFAAACFIGGSFYGVRIWCWPVLLNFWSDIVEPFLRPIVVGSWE